MSTSFALAESFELEEKILVPIN